MLKLNQKLFLVIIMLVTLGFQSVHSADSDSHFSVSGDITVSVAEARASMVKLAKKYPAITIVASSVENERLGERYSVNLFFSKDFEAKPGIYPVEFSYRTKTNTLGGSLKVSRTLFSHDTKGTVEFIEFGEQVKFSFEFQVFDGNEKSEGRRSVTVTGEANCEWADIF